MHTLSLYLPRTKFANLLQREVFLGCRKVVASVLCPVPEDGAGTFYSDCCASSGHPRDGAPENVRGRSGVGRTAGVAPILQLREPANPNPGLRRLCAYAGVGCRTSHV